MEFRVMELVMIIMRTMLCAYTISFCMKNKKKKQIIALFILSCTISYFFYLVFEYTSIFNIIEHVVVLICIFAIFDNNKRSAIISASIYYILNNIYALVNIMIIQVHVKKIIFLNDKLLISAKVFIISYLIFIFIYLSKKDNIEKIYDFIYLNNEVGNTIVIFSFITDFISSFYSLQIYDKNMLFETFLVMLTQIFFIIAVICICKIYKQSKIIFLLSRELNEKNKDLRVIKNNHADILIYMRKLHRLGYVKEIGNVLKSIINGQEISLKEKNIYTNNAILSIMTDIAVNNGIQVNINENSDLSLCKMNQMELYQVLNNIFSNAIRALSSQKEKIINIRINKCKDDLIIEIENNGPKIDEATKIKIFQTGFTTKKNEDSSHGYGLSIVKELIENNNGSIEVKSTDLLTNFKIVLPCK